MCKKVTPLVLLVLIVGVSSSASAADFNWIGDPGDPNAALSFCDASAWDGGSVPGAADTAYINPPPYQGPVVDCDVSVANIFGPRNNSDANQVMDIVGGKLDVVFWLLADSGNGTATVNISGDPTINIGGLEGANSGTTILNITDSANITTGEVHPASSEGSMLIMNISGNASITANDKWQFADNGTAIVNISGNPNIVINSQWRNGDEENGYIEIHMSGGSLYTDRYLCIYDDGSGLFDFSGGTAQLGGLSFSGRNCEATAEINVSGTANITAYDLNLSYGGCGSSTVNISGGRLYCDGSMKMAEGTATSTLNMTGGSLVVKSRIYAPFGESAKGVINLGGGTIECREFYHQGGNWLLDVCGGTMIIDSNVVPTIEADIATGRVIACGGRIGSFVVVDYDNVNPGKTTIWAESAPLVSDFNDDGIVDGRDLAFFVERWLGRCRVGEWCDDCDLNQSGTVNFGDFAVLAAEWLAVGAVL